MVPSSVATFPLLMGHLTGGKVGGTGPMLLLGGIGGRLIFMEIFFFAKLQNGQFCIFPRNFPHIFAFFPHLLQFCSAICIIFDGVFLKIKYGLKKFCLLSVSFIF